MSVAAATSTAVFLAFVEQALGPALAAITPQDTQGWFRLAGHPPPE